MTYRSDRQVAEDLLPVLLFHSVVYYGINDPESDEAKTLFRLFEEAQAEALAGLSPKKAASLLRRAYRMHEDLINPYKAAETAVAKFALVVYYVLDKIRENGLLNLVEGSPFDEAVTALLSPEGTITQFANINKIDISAQKQARKMLASLQANGFYRGAIWE